VNASKSTIAVAIAWALVPSAARADDPNELTANVRVGAGYTSGSISGSPGGVVDVEMATPSPIRWFGTTSASYAYSGLSLAARPLGIAWHDGDALVGIAAGLGYETDEFIHGGTDADVLSVSVRAEIPACPAHLSLFLDVDDGFGRTSQGNLVVGASLRFVGVYWDAMGGRVGPTLTAGIHCADVRDPDGGNTSCPWDRDNYHTGLFVLAGAQLTVGR